MKMAGAQGCVGFMLLRRDRPAAGGKGAKKGGGYSLPDDKFNYSTCTIWASKEVWCVASSLALRRWLAFFTVSLLSLVLRTPWVQVVSLCL